MEMRMRCVLGFALCIVLGQAVRAAEAPPQKELIPTDGLIAYYPLHGNANEASGKAESGKVIGAKPTQDRFGRDQHALAFDGVRDEVVIAPPPGLSAKAMTVSLWVRLDRAKAPAGWVDIGDDSTEFCDPIIGQDDGYSIRCWQLWMMGRKLVWHRMCEYRSVWTDWNLEAGKWYHVAAVFDGARHHLYVDGKEEGESSPGILKVCPSEPIRIGSKGDENGGKRAFFRGAIDSVRLYNRALMGPELLALSREGKDDAPMAADAAGASPATTGGKPPAELPETLRHLSLAGAIFDDINMKNATFHNINMSGVAFDDINMRNAAFHNINMSDVSISAVQMGGAKFKHIGLPPGSKEKQRPLSFEEADLNGATISKCDLSNMRIQDCTITGMTINGILVTDLLAGHK